MTSENVVTGDDFPHGLKEHLQFPSFYRAK